ncbi:MAG: hypothetical protein ABJM06_08270 [Gilvibacter sp.]
MKQTTTLFKSIAIVLLLLPVVGFANNDKFKGKYTKEKTEKKEYTVSANASLEVDNSYGNIDIVTWNENRVVIEVVIRTNGNNEEKVQKKLDEISVDFSGSTSLVSAKTKFKKAKSTWSWWGSSSKKNGVSMEVNYTIKMPASNSVNLSNDYGGISIDRLEGNARIDCDYGQLEIGELLADDNFLTFDYTRTANIRYMKSGKIDADYSDFTLEKVESLELDTDYTKSEILDVVSLTYNCDYGRLEVGKVERVRGNGDYIPQNFDRVRSSLDIDSDYGSITVDDFSSDIKNVKINSSYAGIKLGFSSNAQFSFNLDLSYASLKGEDDFNVTSTNKNGSKKQYAGYAGSQSSGNAVNIRSSYGGVTFRKN